MEVFKAESASSEYTAHLVSLRSAATAGEVFYFQPQQLAETGSLLAKIQLLMTGALAIAVLAQAIAF
ncbi:hypothetical protein HNQ93_000374 [Hymenobacter luteus]|uniref:Uncharacterized protein n=2 Tax=Hymenobacter TaxID=89966 RepID=A0A7W9SZ37_9BACT|nr:MULTISPECIES: hypothetical protein [Hymenobacter]MBB4600146.1 hypothetical protein [Hymenobacter latericoloratus]MBB6057544.1 hypothetical protein [Hymenobacter luteus]